MVSSRGGAGIRKFHEQHRAGLSEWLWRGERRRGSATLAATGGGYENGIVVEQNAEEAAEWYAAVGSLSDYAAKASEALLNLYVTGKIKPTADDEIAEFL